MLCTNNNSDNDWLVQSKWIIFTVICGTQRIYPIFPLSFRWKYAPKFCCMLKIFTFISSLCIICLLRLVLQLIIPVCGPKFWYSLFWICFRIDCIFSLEEFKDTGLLLTSASTLPESTSWQTYNTKLILTLEKSVLFDTS